MSSESCNLTLHTDLGSLAPHLVAEFGSPLYVYDLAAIREAYRAFAGAFPYAHRAIHYAIVTNKNPAVVQTLLALGAGVHANTPGDAFAALAAGMPATNIVYSGANVDRADLEFLLGHGIRLNLDSLDQLSLLATVDVPAACRDVGLRVLVDEPERGNRIGLAPDDIPGAVDVAARAGLRIVGLHMYAGTNTRRVERFLEGLDRLIGVAELLPNLQEIDLGGGYGVAYRDGQAPLDLGALGRDVTARLDALSARRGRAIRLVLEPGRSLVAASGSLLMTVVAVKERGGRRYVGVDSTVGNIAAESVYHPYHRIEALTAPGEPLDGPTDVVGNTTHSRDYLARDVALPRLVPGDLLALRDVGAYGYALASHFLNRPRPGEVVIDGPAIRLTTRRETMADLLALYVRP